MEQKKGKVLATSNQVTSKGNVEIEMFYKRKNIKTLNVILRATEKHGSSFESHQKNEVY